MTTTISKAISIVLRTYQLWEIQEYNFFLHRIYFRPVQELSGIPVQPMSKLLSNYFASAGLHLTWYESQFLILIYLKKREQSSLREHSETVLSNWFFIPYSDNFPVSINT